MPSLRRDIVSPDPQHHLGELTTYYASKHRPEAIRNLVAAVRRAMVNIQRAPSAGFLAPRPYPALTLEACRWVKEGSYWIAYTDTADSIILGIYHEAADIPHRM